MNLSHISILGLGLLGGSVGLASRRSLKGCELIGYDVNANSRQKAITSGAVAKVTESAVKAVEAAELVVLCVPLGAIEQVIGEIAPSLRPGTVVTDVSSTKRSVVEKCENLLPPGVHFVGAHPMAGGEACGIDAARADLFRDAQCLLTPTAKTDPNALKTVHAYWRTLGMRTMEMTPQRHDELVAQISHLPHAIASALMNVVSDEATPVAGPGFRDVTRIAAGDGALWRDILTDNADQVRAILARFRAELDRFDAMLESGRDQELRQWLDSAAERRRQMKQAVESRP